MTNEILEQILMYLQNQNSPKNTWDIVITYVVPVITALALTISSIAAVLKYYSDKKRTFAEKMLKEVYAPLFLYIVKQEYYRKNYKGAKKLDDQSLPIFSVTKRKTKTTYTADSTTVENSDPIPVIDAGDIYEVTKSINFGLVPTDLLILITTHYMDDTGENDKKQAQKRDLILRKAIIDGYLKYRKQLGLKRKSALIEYTENNIIFKTLK